LALWLAPWLIVLVLLMMSGCAPAADVQLARSPGCEPGWLAGPQRVSPMFLPAASRLPDEDLRVVELPPMELFNDRPVWPAPTDTRLGEVTFYREWYYDRQNSHSGGRGHIHNSVYRRFEIYRTGVLIR
jgi:hypothetical protein